MILVGRNHKNRGLSQDQIIFAERKNLGGGFKYFVFFYSFQLGWNRQLEIDSLKLTATNSELFSEFTPENRPFAPKKTKKYSSHRFFRWKLAVSFREGSSTNKKTWICLRWCFTDSTHGIHHHFSPPFKGECCLSFFQPPNQQIQVDGCP